MAYEISTVGFATIVELRSVLLDPSGANPSIATDDVPSARHVGAFRDDTLVGVASIHPQRMPGERTGAWRLIGVAIDHGHRGAGVGALLVERCLEHAAEGGAKTVWCLAPAGAFGFFERLGFGRRGDPIDDPDLGPQYLLSRQVEPLRRDWAIQGA